MHPLSFIFFRRLFCWLLACYVCVTASPAAETSDRYGYMNHHDAVHDFAQKLGTMFEEGDCTDLAVIEEQLEQEEHFTFRPAKATGENMSAQAVYEQCREGVVKIGKVHKCDDCEDWHSKVATGFIIGADGIVVTAYHVVAADNKGKAIGVQTYDGTMLAVERVLASDEHNDVAVLKVNGDDLTALPVAEDVNMGEAVAVISHPVQKFYVLTEGVVSGKAWRKVHGQGRRELSITADYAKGSSGGPVLNMRGEVVGMVRATVPVYYEKKHGVDTSLQMVWKYCTPSVSLLDVMVAPNETTDNAD